MPLVGANLPSAASSNSRNPPGSYLVNSRMLGSNSIATTNVILYQVPEGFTLGFPDQRRVDSRLANTRGSPCPLRFGLILTLRWLGWPRSGRRTGRRRGGF